eukprot:8274134-Pyramimonas_sp.AAC.1
MHVLSHAVRLELDGLVRAVLGASRQQIRAHNPAGEHRNPVASFTSSEPTPDLHIAMFGWGGALGGGTYPKVRMRKKPTMRTPRLLWMARTREDTTSFRCDCREMMRSGRTCQ